ncbi:MAG: STAS domain-containing protein [Spirochaetes bacterium]|nr:STAS domain-containing protein [Spirochaetota bacterium]
MKTSSFEHDTYITGILEGSITNETLHDFERFLCEIEKKQKHIILDLSNLSFIMSSGLSALLSFNNTLRQKGLLFIICGLKNDMEKLFSHTGIISHLTIYPTHEDAIQKIKTV